MSRQWLSLPLALTLLMAPMFTATAMAQSLDDPGGGFEDSDEYQGGLHGEAEIDDHRIDVDAGLVENGTPGSDGTVDHVEGAPEPAREGAWITVTDLVFDGTGTACLRTTDEFFEGISPDDAEVIRWTWINQFVARYEAYISAGNEPPLPCDGGDGTPGFDPTPSQQFNDSAEQILPRLTPAISGDYAITGLRSWLDLGRPASLTTTHEFTLGPTTITATITATATATIDWGDGTVTSHTSQGGGYHEGEPGPDDITHTYRDAVDSNTLKATDSWDVLISFPDSPVPDISLTWGAEPVTMTFPIREVRSTRDS